MKLIDMEKFRLSLFFNAKIVHWTMFGIYISWGEKIAEAGKVENIGDIHNESLFFGFSYANQKTLREIMKQKQEAKT